MTVQITRSPTSKGGRMMALIVANTRRALARIDLELIGEGLACASLFVLLWCFLLIGHAWGLK